MVGAEEREKQMEEGMYFKITQETYPSQKKYLILHIEWLNEALYRLIL